MDLSNSSSGEAATEEEKELEDKKMKDSRKVKRIQRICSKKSKNIDPSFPQEKLVLFLARSFISSKEFFFLF